MGYFGVVFILTVVSITLGHEDCPPVSAISPCTCDGEGISCLSTATKAQIRKAFCANYPFGGVFGVYVQGTELDEITAGTFCKLKSQSFYLELNKIKFVNLSAFEYTKNYIKSFSLYGNEMTKIPEGNLQTAMPNLMSCNYGKNKITSIGANAFRHDTLAVLILAQNSITSIGTNAFFGLPNLQKLELSFNQLTTLTPYSIALSSMLFGLQINLAVNKISDISNTAFDGANPQVLILVQNQLKSLKQEVFSTILNRISQHGGVVDVSGNPLTCKGCDYKWIVNNKYVLHNIIAGFMCPDGTGIATLTGSKIGC